MVPTVAEEEILVDLAAQDAECAAFLGAFAADAVARLQGLFGGARVAAERRFG